jgi:N-acyl-L-homoserine lactone synthetase
MAVAPAGEQEVAMDTMQTAEIGTEQQSDALFAGMLQGYRFRVCKDPESVAKALEVRRAVYVEENGYDIPVPDQYDFWSWLLIAEDVRTGQVVGTMRLTPRSEGPLESEEYFQLPRRLRSPKTAEINRFAILRSYRKGATFLPVVSIGLFKLAREISKQEGWHTLVICSKAERAWTYCWLGFEQTGLKASYAKLHDVEHEVLTFDLRRVDQIFAANPLAPFFLTIEHSEIELPMAMPPVGLVDPSFADHVLIRKSA